MSAKTIIEENLIQLRGDGSESMVTQPVKQTTGEIVTDWKRFEFCDFFVQIRDFVASPEEAPFNCGRNVEITNILLLCHGPNPGKTFN